MISVQLDDIRPPVPSISPRFSGAVNMTLTITPDIANGEIGFISNRTVVLLEPEDTNSSLVKPFTVYVAYTVHPINASIRQRSCLLTYVLKCVT